jgi:hypothetical protein
MKQETLNNYLSELRIQLAAARLLLRGSVILRWSLTLLILIFPPIYLAFKPQDYTPIVQVLFSIFLFLLAFWTGNSNEIQRATKRANDRWLPQAESVIFRLMTLRANIIRFSRSTKVSCTTSNCDLPELEKEEMRAVRVKFKAECESSSQRLDDVAHQLEDAIEDWRRFIIANCQGDECQRIFEALQQRENGLKNELAENIK